VDMMITEPTVMILGAGASKPFTFPTGSELKVQICKNLHPTHKSFKLLVTKYDHSLIKEFVHNLRYSGTPSVDAFLEHRIEFIEVGKAAIAQALLPCERTENLFRLDNLNWYEYLYGKMNADFEDFKNNKISFITFNYDRSLEQYLYTALIYKYGKTSEECIKILEQIPIIHLYGKLGALPFEEQSGLLYDTNDPNIEQITTAANGIKIVSENTINDNEFNLAHQYLKDAKRIYFIGFGYNPTNLDRLKFDKIPQGKIVKGSSYHFTDQQMNEVRDYFLKKNRIRIDLKFLGAYGFIKNVPLI
jgi:hypothetical protein